MCPMTNGSVTDGDLRFRTGAAMLARLGSEQLKDEITAVMELVKNAYDADATRVAVQLQEGHDGQRLIIEDDGTGMTRDDLDSKWAFLATENKVREDRSPKSRRRRLGRKGVGRFATEKLGGELVLRTSTASGASKLQIRFNWEELSGDRELAEYSFPVRLKKPDAYEPAPGTRLEIRRLRLNWTKSRIERLRNQLSTLIDPEATSTDFKIEFQTPWTDLNGVLQNPLPGSETHRIEFEIDAEGNETTRTFIHGQSALKTQQVGLPQFGPIRGRLRYFGQGLRAIERGRGGDPDMDWNMGVRVFRDGCRVRPYGEPGSEGDWLQIYQARYLRGSRFRLKPHYLEGAIQVSQTSNPNLRDTTSREGLSANEYFLSFVEYVKGKVAELSELVREEELKQERSRMQERYKRALDPLTAGLNQVRSEEYRSAVEAADKQVRKGIGTRLISEVRNVHWECLDCSDSWKVPRGSTPQRCREYSVGRDGRPTNKPGCGSTSIRRKENLSPDNPKQDQNTLLEDVMSGAPAYVEGIQLRPQIDWNMGENDEEAEVRAVSRELAINGRHRAFRAADLLDGNETVEGTVLEELRAVAALTIHVIDSASQAWGRWHYLRSGGQFESFMNRATELKDACLLRISSTGARSAAD
jgi:Histidine kinase-, DNA gyrase B-, and HSP90-like ATPase